MQTKKQLPLISSNCALCELLTIQKGLVAYNHNLHLRCLSSEINFWGADIIV